MTTGLPLGIDALDGGCRRSLLEIGKKLVQGRLVAFCDDLDGVVYTVAHVALKVQAAGHLPGEKPIADPLHLSVDAGLQSFLFQGNLSHECCDYKPRIIARGGHECKARTVAQLCPARSRGCVLDLFNRSDNVVHILVVAEELGLLEPDCALAEVFRDRAGRKGGKIGLGSVPRIDLT